MTMTYNYITFEHIHKHSYANEQCVIHELIHLKVLNTNHYPLI